MIHITLLKTKPQTRTFLLDETVMHCGHVSNGHGEFEDQLELSVMMANHPRKKIARK